MTARVLRARRRLLAGSAAAVALALLAPVAPARADDPAAYPVQDAYAELDAAFAAGRVAAADGLVLRETDRLEFPDDGAVVVPKVAVKALSRRATWAPMKQVLRARVAQLRSSKPRLVTDGVVLTATSVSKVDMRNAIAWSSAGPGMTFWQGAGRGVLLPVVFAAQGPRGLDKVHRALSLLHKSNARWVRLRPGGGTWKDAVDGTFPSSTSDWIVDEVLANENADISATRVARTGGGYTYVLHVPGADTLLSIPFDVRFEVDADGRIVGVGEAMSLDGASLSMATDFLYQPVTLSWPDATMYVSAAHLRKAMSALALEAAADRLVRRQVKRATVLQLDPEQAYLSARYDKRDRHLGPHVRLRQEPTGFRVVVENRFRDHPVVWHVAQAADGSFASS